MRSKEVRGDAIEPRPHRASGRVESHPLSEGGNKHVPGQVTGGVSAAQPCQVSPHSDMMPGKELPEALWVGHRGAHKIGVIRTHTPTLPPDSPGSRKSCLELTRF